MLIDNEALGLFWGPTGQGGFMRIMHCPQHENSNIPHNLQEVKRLNPLSVGFTEMEGGGKGNESVRLARQILTDHTICTANVGTHSEEVPIALRKGPETNDRGCKVIKLSNNIPGDSSHPGLGNDRYMTIRTFEHRGYPYFHIATHWNAALQTKPTGAIRKIPRVTVMEKASQLLETHINNLRKSGMEGWITGDFNYYHPSAAPVWKFAPEKVFQRTGMKFHAEHIDYIAWTPGLLEHTIRVITHGGPINLSDHPWLIGHFSRK